MHIISSAEQVFSFYDYREESSAFIAFLGSALSVALVLIFVPKYSKRAKAQGKTIHQLHHEKTSFLHMRKQMRRSLGGNQHETSDLETREII